MTSTINRNIPVAGTVVAAEPISANFNAAADDIEALQAEIAALGAPIATVITAPGPITLTSADRLVLVNQTIAAAITIHLLPSPATDLEVQIKDYKGDAGINNITINTTDSSTIDGAASQLININRGSLDLYYSHSLGNWSIL